MSTNKTKGRKRETHKIAEAGYDVPALVEALVDPSGDDADVRVGGADVGDALRAGDDAKEEDAVLGDAVGEEDLDGFVGAATCR